MCGIIGYIGKNKALPVLIEGLKRLEYRGYDSAGIAVYDNNEVKCAKAVGKIKELEKKLKTEVMTGSLGIAHTRWATHGAPSEINAHPHSDCKGETWVVHNGIIENYQQLKTHLIEKGHQFKSETDTEVLSHLIEDLYNDNIIETTRKALKLIKGTYGLAIIHKKEPTKVIAARRGSPLLVGLGENENIVASDASAILQYTKQVVYLEDGEIAEVADSGIKIYDLEANEILKDPQLIEWEIDQVEKNGFPHFMLKEIFEQPETIVNSTRGRMILKDGKIKLGGLENVLDKIRETKKIIIVGCGTARHAGLVGEYMIEEYAGIPVEVEYASEFRYRKPVMDKNTALIAISQSGETADTLAAIKEAKEKSILTVGIVNVVGSTIARTTNAGVYNHIGPEISVASTKAFTSQVTILALFSVLFGRQREMSMVMGKRILEELSQIPDKIKFILNQNEKIKEMSARYSWANDFAFLGRKYNQPVAFEAALKLKELSYIHAEGFASGEMKHGPIAMIDKEFPSVFIIPNDSVYEKNLSNMEEIKARAGKIIAIATEGNKEIPKLADDVVFIPKSLEMLTPILSTIPLQLFAYHMAVLKGNDVDKPRNLAKSVTVE